MTTRIKLVQGDTFPSIRVTLTDETSGAPIDLTGATVTMHFRAVGEAAPLFSLVATVYPSEAVLGKAVFTWGPTSLNQTPGDYEGEVEVYWASSGARQTVYEFLKFRLREDIA